MSDEQLQLLESLIDRSFVLPFQGRPEHAARFDRDLQAALRELRKRRVLD